MIGFIFCFVCCLDEASCTGCYWWFGDAWSCILVVTFVCVLTIWYPVGLVRRRQWQPTPVLLPGKSRGQKSLVGCSSWGRKEWGMTDRLHFHALEKEMAIHSSVLAWRIPRTVEPDGLLSMGLHRVRHNWSNLAAAAAAAGLILC